MPTRPQPPADLVDRVAAICTTLPEVAEVDAWTGLSWRVGTKTFAHVLQIDDGWPPAYVRAAGTSGPQTVLTFQAEADERAAFAAQGAPYFLPPWRPGIVGLRLDGTSDWVEIAELLTESYCLLAPRRLSAQVRGRG